jgi:CheY-like chemotaxis protein
MEGAGTVSISARNMGRDEPRIDVVPAGDNVVLSVRSAGAGMPGDVLLCIAETFFETKGNDECVGDAMASVRDIVEASSGAIVIRSILDQVTAVDVILPRADTGQGNVNLKFDGEVSKPSRVKILVVDDDKDIREIITECLGDLGYIVVAAATAQSAYETVRTSPDVDMVVTDVVMPDIDGVTLAKMVRSYKPDLPFVFVTGYARDFILQGERVLAKPFTLGDLALLVARGLEERSYCSAKFDFGHLARDIGGFGGGADGGIDCGIPARRCHHALHADPLRRDHFSICPGVCAAAHVAPRTIAVAGRPVSPRSADGEQHPADHRVAP